MLDTFLGNFIASNSGFDYIQALAVFIILLVVFGVAEKILLRKLDKLAAKTKTDIDDTLVDIVESIKPPFYYFVAFYFALRLLSLPDLLLSVITGVLIAWVVYQIIVALQILIDYVINKKFIKDKDAGSQAAAGFLSGIFKIALWIIGILLVLSNLGVNITSLVAGLGIGGLAIAFALQRVFADIFSALAIYLDKPFQVGDFIISGAHSGTVEKIGIKTTRIRASNGELVIISNQEMTDTRVQNFKKLERRRAVVSIGVTYNTPASKLRAIPKIMQSIVDSVDNATYDRAHLKTFSASSLDFELVFYIESADYGRYMDANQEVNMKLVEAFAKESIDFAYPTQTVYLEK
jgi:small-conductance mechanosensitive channel